MWSVEEGRVGQGCGFEARHLKVCRPGRVWERHCCLHDSITGARGALIGHHGAGSARGQGCHARWQAQDRGQGQGQEECLSKRVTRGGDGWDRAAAAKEPSLFLSLSLWHLCLHLEEGMRPAGHRAQQGLDLRLQAPQTTHQLSMSFVPAGGVQGLTSSQPTTASARGPTSLRSTATGRNLRLLACAAKRSSMERKLLPSAGAQRASNQRRGGLLAEGRSREKRRTHLAMQKSTWSS